MEDPQFTETARGHRGHTSTKCKVDKDIVCHKCKKRGHMERACKSKGKPASSKPKRKAVKNLLDVQGEEEEENNKEENSDDSSIGKVNARKKTNPLIKV